MRIRLRLTVLIIVMMVLGFSATQGSETSEQARASFKAPSRHYSNAPLWVWNDLLTENQIRDSMRDLARQNVKQVFVHPRPGLMTPYLSEDWFRLWKVALREAEKLDMSVWIYDENSYPSGFAGGFVPEAMAQSRGQGLAFRESKKAPAWDKDILGVYLLAENTKAQERAYENVTTRIQHGENLPEAKYLIAYVRWAQSKPWHGGYWYVNLLTPGVTEKFIDLTHSAYKQNLGDYFGKRIPGIFTDEPNIRPVEGTLPWGPVVLAEFKKRWGYDLLDHLPSLDRSVGDFRKVRHNFYQLLHEQFVEHWAKPNFEYCAANNLEWTGHYWDHRWPECDYVPDSMAMYAWHQRPSIDCLMNQYREATDAQFGNVRMVRELSSVANQLGLKRTLCEAYGAGGWDLRFEDMKRIGDWLQVLGVNTLDEHLSFISIRGARKRDHPQSFSYHEPWWDAYHLSARYFARLSAALSHGEQVNKVAVLEPTTTAWMYQENAGRLKEIGKSFFDFLMALEAAQIEYDLVSEDVLAKHGAIGAPDATSDQRRTIRIGQREYHTFVIPPYTENLNHETQQLLEQTGVRRLVAGSMPNRIDGALLGQPQNFDFIRTNTAQWIHDTVDALQACQRQAPIYIRRAEGDKGILFHMRRDLADGQLLFLVNTSIEHGSKAEVVSRLPGVESWDLHTGNAEPYPVVQRPDYTSAPVELPPSGSLLLLFKTESRQRSEPSPQIVRTIEPTGEMKTERKAENVLTLDFLDVKVAGESLTNVYFQRAAELVWKKHGLEKNPWDSAVQFQNRLVTRAFPADSGFEASYRFNIKKGALPRRLSFVLEKPELYSIEFNGKPVRPSGKWWLDKDFGRIDISSLARPGENVMRIMASPMTIVHELEPAYVVGSFALEPAPSGFVIVEPRPITLGRATPRNSHSTNPDGTMWLSAGVGFRKGLDDRAPWLLFDLGAQTHVSAIKLWNYNEARTRDLTGRGARVVRVKSGTTETAQDELIGEFTLRRGDNFGLPETIPAGASGARFIRLEFLSNYRCVRYPFEGKGDPDQNDHAMVGLSEVQFLDGNGKPISDTRVADYSSELPSQGRLAKSLVDGSGLEEGREGWSQGYPFYGHRVAYTEKFEVPRRTGRYVLRLPSWNGSVAQVRVNGRQAGWIFAPPFECDVTKHIKRGANKVEVTVIGTLKNTLGPHHDNPTLGTAWPSKFKTAPEFGPPAGAGYSTVAYGLFQRMELKNIIRVF